MTLPISVTMSVNKQHGSSICHHVTVTGLPIVCRNTIEQHDFPLCHCISEQHDILICVTKLVSMTPSKAVTLLVNMTPSVSFTLSVNMTAIFVVMSVNIKSFPHLSPCKRHDPVPHPLSHQWTSWLLHICHHVRECYEYSMSVITSVNVMTVPYLSSFQWPW